MTVLRRGDTTGGKKFGCEIDACSGGGAMPLFSTKSANSAKNGSNGGFSAKKFYPPPKLADCIAAAGDWYSSGLWTYFAPVKLAQNRPKTAQRRTARNVVCGNCAWAVCCATNSESRRMRSSSAAAAARFASAASRCASRFFSIFS